MTTQELVTILLNFISNVSRCQGIFYDAWILYVDNIKQFSLPGNIFLAGISEMILKTSRHYIICRVHYIPRIFKSLSIAFRQVAQ